MSDKHLEKVRELFERYDTDKDNSLNMNELAVLLSEIGNKLTALPAVIWPSRFSGTTKLPPDGPSGITTRKVSREETVQACKEIGHPRCERVLHTGKLR